MAMLDLAKIYLEPGDLHDFSKVRDWYAIAAEHGNVSAEALVRIMDVLGYSDFIEIIKHEAVPFS